MHILKNRREQASVAERSLMGSPAVVVAGVTIVVSELMLEAGAYTIVFAVAVTVADKAAEEAWRAACAAHYAACKMTQVSRKKGNHWKQTRCADCMNRCTHDRTWPSAVGAWDDDGTCEYWRPNWGR